MTLLFLLITLIFFSMKLSQLSFKLYCIVFIIGLICNQNSYSQSSLTINEMEYFDMPGLSVMVFDDYYPVGRQGGGNYYPE